MTNHRDTITGDDRDEGGIAAIGGGAPIASDGGVGTLFGRPAATSGERADSLLVPDVEPPDASPTHAAPGQVGETVGGTLLAPDAGDGVTPM